jgi:hypothetical protein
MPLASPRLCPMMLDVGPALAKATIHRHSRFEVFRTRVRKVYGVHVLTRYLVETFPDSPSTPSPQVVRVSEPHDGSSPTSMMQVRRQYNLPARAIASYRHWDASFPFPVSSSITCTPGPFRLQPPFVSCATHKYLTSCEFNLRARQVNFSSFVGLLSAMD